MKTILTAVILVVLSSSAWAKALVFDADRKELAVNPANRFAQLAFEFKNSSNKTIFIAQASASCGCTEVVFEKSNIGPLETGRMTLKVDLKGKMLGKTPISVKIITDEVAEYEISAMFRAPAKIQIHPQMLRWSMGAAASPKIVTIKIENLRKAEPLIKIVSLDVHGMEFVVKRVSDDNETSVVYEITPGSTLQETRGTASVKLSEEYLDGELPQLYVYVSRAR